MELAIVFALVGLRLGWLASLAGVATQMALIPTQASQLAPARRVPVAAACRAASANLPCWPGAARPPRPQPPAPPVRTHPMQGALVRYIGRLRASTAAQTDERVRLTGEVVSGVLATKMLGGWMGGQAGVVGCSAAGLRGCGAGEWGG